MFAGENGELTLEAVQQNSPTWNYNDLIYGLEQLQEVSEQCDQYVYPVYTGEEVEKDPHLRQVQLIYLPAYQKRSDYYAILLAGGAYGAVCTMAESLPVGAKLNELGITCFCLNYRTAVQESFSTGLMPKPLDDLAAAWRFIQAHQDQFGVNAEDYIVGGFSAGGHAAAMWGTAHLGFRKYGIPAPRMLLLGYPLITMENQKPGQMKDYISLGMFGAGYTEDDIRRYAVNRHVDAAYPKVYLVQSMDDDTIPPKDSEDFAIALEKAGVPFRMERLDSGGHGFDLGSATPLNGWVERAVAFLSE
ncbi:MAG: alpha/beta hydrolase [Chloroflexi bacterium]|nr:alpha/beta hydrolase [Chloroflexota bacterium]